MVFRVLRVLLLCRLSSIAVQRFVRIQSPNFFLKDFLLLLIKWYEKVLTCLVLALTKLCRIFHLSLYCMTFTHTSVTRGNLFSDSLLVFYIIQDYSEFHPGFQTFIIKKNENEYSKYEHFKQYKNNSSCIAISK